MRISEDTDVLMLDDKLVVNEKFESKLRHVKVPLIMEKLEIEEDIVHVSELLEEDRKYLVEADIVRVMKSRRICDHGELFGEVVKLLAGRFVPDKGLVKNRIENLIEREFIKRDDGNRNMYHYVA